MSLNSLHVPTLVPNVTRPITRAITSQSSVTAWAFNGCLLSPVKTSICSRNLIRGTSLCTSYIMSPLISRTDATFRNLDFEADYKSSRIFKEASYDLLNVMATLNVTMNNHNWGIGPASFKSTSVVAPYWLNFALIA